MATTRRYPPNRQLAWERLERGWSHDELCAQIKRSMRDVGEAETGLTANTVRRWNPGTLTSPYVWSYPVIRSEPGCGMRKVRSIARAGCRRE